MNNSSGNPRNDSEHRIDRRRFLQSSGKIAGAAALAAGLGGLETGSVHAKFLPSKKATVETTSGSIRGGIADGVYIFRGVPYGASTGGDNRFLPPNAPKKWSGVRDTVEYGNGCPQSSRNLVKPAALSWFTPFWPASTSEDCLFLNVWTPALKDGGKRPVMVWLHGGGYSTGSGASSSYDGTNNVKRGDVVSITINHRLNVFGYTHLDDIMGENFKDSGNAGMLDIVLALDWVRDNIENFGGDPDNVMIFGESGGGAKVSTLLGMPGAKGLFHRAAIQSGPGIRVSEPDAATITATMLLDELGIKSGAYKKLQAVPHKQLHAAHLAIGTRASRAGGAGFRPVLGDAVPQHPFDPVGSPLSADVPVLIGTNQHETALFSVADTEVWTLDDAGLAARAQRLAGDASDELLRVYRGAFPDSDPTSVYFAMASDRGTRMRSILLAERKAQQGAAPVYMYRFDWLTHAWEGRFRAAHAFEIPFVFGNAQLNDEITGGGPDAVDLAAKMSAAWIAFARTGNPNHAAIPRWNAYTEKARNTMLFNDECQAVDDPGGNERRFWKKQQSS